jgi:glutaminyl-tRNA synthetase
MSDNIPLKKPTNFIRNQINTDLDSGLHDSVITRFPPEPNGHLHIMMDGAI